MKKSKNKNIGIFILVAIYAFIAGALVVFGFGFNCFVVHKYEFAHSYTIQNPSEIYLKDPATCMTKAVYYYSCSCGKQGDETFEYGKVDNQNHCENIEYTVVDSLTHTKKIVCINCKHLTVYNDIPHSFNESQMCTECGFQKQRINLENYESYISYDGMLDVGEEIAKEIINVIHNPEKYEEVIYKKEKCLTFQYPKKISQETYWRLYGFFVFYFGDFNVWGVEYFKCDGYSFEHIFDAEIGHNYTDFYIPVSSIKPLQERRIKYIQEAEAVLGNLYEGTETEMLLQICDLMKNYVILPGAPCDSCTDFWATKKSTCLAYALVFRQLSERLGIHCDVLAGYTVGDGYHGWNRVKLSDGTYKYYDVCWYITGNDPKYIDANSVPHQEFWINCYADDLNKW